MAEWTKEWNRTKRPIKVFHSADCANLAGEFKDWDKAKRDEFVATLLPVLPKYRLLGVRCWNQPERF